MANEKSRATDIRVGLFVTAGVVVLFISIFLIGQERNFFERPAYLKAEFPNVAGLKVGAAVRLSGVDIGIVSDIAFPPADPDIYEKVMPPTTLAALSQRPEKSAQGIRYRALDIGPEALTFDVPKTVRLTATCQAADGAAGACGDTSRTLKIDVVGQDQFGDPLVETFAFGWRGAGNRVEGKKRFKTIEEIRLLENSHPTRMLDGNEQPNTFDRLKIGYGGLPLITVAMRVRQDALERVRDGSAAVLSSDGLLGDKTIDISLGPSSGRQHEDGHTLPSRLSGLDQIVARVPEALETFDQIKNAVNEVHGLISEFQKEGGEDVIIQAVRTLEDIAIQVKEGRGLIHELVYDEKTAQRYAVIIKDVEGAVADVNAMIHQVKSKDSLLHGLMYDPEGEKAVAAAKDTLVEVKQLLADIKSKDGIAHQLIYNEDNGELVANLTQASEDIKTASADAKSAAADVKVMVADAKQGKGTVGALLTDPSVYEDLKVLLGNVKRNDAVKSLVRYAIEKEDAQVKPAP